MDLDILALSKLLQDPDSQNDETEKSPQHGLTPASFGSAAAYRPQSYKRNKNDDECVPTSYDDRKEPPYQLYYKQLVGTEDVFFGTEKSPASSDSTHIVVKVYFPGRSMEDLKLDVTSNRLDVESPDRKLSISLPRTVDSEIGKAKWDATNCILIVSLPIDRSHAFF